MGNSGIFSYEYEISCYSYQERTQTEDYLENQVFCFMAKVMHPQ